MLLNYHPQPSTTLSQTQPSTTLSQTQPSTTLSQTQPSTTLSQTQPSTTLSQTQPSTTLSQTQPSTTLSQTQPSTTLSQTQPSTTLSQKNHIAALELAVCRSWSMRGCQYSTLCYFERSTFSLRSYCVPLSASPIMSPALWGLVQDRLPLSFLPVFLSKMSDNAHPLKSARNRRSSPLQNWMEKGIVFEFEFSYLVSKKICIFN